MSIWAKVNPLKSVMLVELTRLNSHLVWLATHAMEVGAVTVMLYCFRERELLLNINELIAGFRMFPSYVRVGGLREDLPSGFHEAVNDILQRMLSEQSDMPSIEISGEGSEIRIRLNSQTYTTLGDVPDERARELIRAAVAEWERT